MSEGWIGERGIRTPGTLPGTVVFKTTAIDHSAISPFIGARGRRFAAVPSSRSLTSLHSLALRRLAPFRSALRRSRPLLRGGSFQPLAYLASLARAAPARAVPLGPSALAAAASRRFLPAARLPRFTRSRCAGSRRSARPFGARGRCSAAVPSSRSLTSLTLRSRSARLGRRCLGGGAPFLAYSLGPTPLATPALRRRLRSARLGRRSLGGGGRRSDGVAPSYFAVCVRAAVRGRSDVSFDSPN